jgi:hypothetical protein
MFLPSDESTETVDVMQYLWTGSWPKFRSPQLKGFWLDGKTVGQNIRLTADQGYAAKVLVESPAESKLTYVWEIMEESDAKSTGGDSESQPRRLPGLVSSKSPGAAQVKAPKKTGAYRLFVYALDSHGKAAYANIPFFVETGSSPVAAKQ